MENNAPSHKALIKSPGEHVVAIETSQQRKGLRHKHKGRRLTGIRCGSAAALDRAEENKIHSILKLKTF